MLYLKQNDMFSSFKGYSFSQIIILINYINKTKTDIFEPEMLRLPG